MSLRNLFRAGLVLYLALFLGGFAPHHLALSGDVCAVVGGSQLSEQAAPGHHHSQGHCQLCLAGLSVDNLPRNVSAVPYLTIDTYVPISIREVAPTFLPGSVFGRAPPAFPA